MLLNPNHNVPSVGLLTDLYQLTMAYGYWKSGIAQKESVFHLFFRTAPFNGGFTIACGLHDVIEVLENYHFSAEDLDYLKGLEGNDGKALFAPEFVDHLKDLRLNCDIDAVPEGSVVFPHEPLLRIQGPLLQCQLLETILLNIVNFQTLIATKTARIRLAAGDDPVFEFGLRRAQGTDGALTASRASYVGGCTGTSNVLAGRLFGIPVKGTIAHSWVMSFGDELESFKAYAKAQPNNALFIVDTYSTLNGVKNAIEVGLELQKEGHGFMGIRLDSGDLAYLSIEARKMLDESGLTDAKIVASNELDETIISSLKSQNAKIDIWGVGTKLVTAYDQPALNGVYKISAIRDFGKEWEYRVKISEQTAKVTTPGRQQVRRYLSEAGNRMDVIYDVDHDMSLGCTSVDPLDMTRQRKISKKTDFQDLLIPIFRKGEKVYTLPSIETTRSFVQSELKRFHPGILRFVNPHQYPVGIEKSLFDKKTELIFNLRNPEE